MDVEQRHKLARRSYELANSKIQKKKGFTYDSHAVKRDTNKGNTDTRKVEERNRRVEEMNKTWNRNLECWGNKWIGRRIE